jgi:hypothetical protein
MERKMFLPLIIAILSIVFHFALPYTSIQEIFEDPVFLNTGKLAKFRGPVLKEMWLDDQLDRTDSNHPNDEEVCRLLFTQSLDSPDIAWPPPEHMPKEMMSDYLMGGLSDHLELYFVVIPFFTVPNSLKNYLYSFFVCAFFSLQEKQNGADSDVWDTAYIDEWRARPNTCGQYYRTTCQTAFTKHQNIIQNHTGVIIGSQLPWAEAGLLNAGVKSLITIEYMMIETEYPGLTTMHPTEVALEYLDGDWEPMDFAFTYSSLEHDGLGRYGDPLNPFGDLESLARIRCLLKPGGILFFGVPSAQDAVVWNAHRLYGRYRLALAFIGWTVVDAIDLCDVTPKSAGVDDCQPIFVLQKPWGLASSSVEAPEL